MRVDELAAEFKALVLAEKQCGADTNQLYFRVWSNGSWQIVDGCVCVAHGEVEL